MNKRRNVRRAVASVLILVWITAMMVSCSGSNSADNASTSASDTAEKYEYESQASTEGAAQDAYEGEAGGTGDSSLSGTVNTGSIDPEKQKIIRNARIEMQTKEFSKSVEDLTNRAAELGGYVESSDIQGQNYEGSRRGELTIRIPYQNMDVYINNVRGFGEMISESIQSQDVSGAYFDAQARMKSLQIQLERYEAIMAQSAKLEDILTLEKEIAQVRYEIESLQGSIKSWDDRVSYSSVTITIWEVSDYVPAPVAPTTLGERVGNAFRSSWRTAWNIVQNAIVLVVVLLPLLLLIGLILLIVFFVLRRQNSKRAQAKEKEHSLSKTDDTAPKGEKDKDAES